MTVHQRNLTPEQQSAWTDYTPAGPWTDGTQVTRNIDGVLFTYSSSLNALTVIPNQSGSIKNANSFIIQNLPTPASSGDAANKAYVDAHSGSAVSPSNSNPIINGVAAPGSSALYSRGDHVHPIVTITLSGDISGSGAPAITTTLATVNATVGTFQGITVNAKGLVTNATNQGYLTGNQTVTISGDATGSGATTIALTLATVNSNVGTFQGITVNGKGLVTGAVNMNYALASSVPVPATVAPIMDSVAAVGTSLLYARQDHVHPSDTNSTIDAGTY